MTVELAKPICEPWCQVVEEQFEFVIDANPPTNHNKDLDTTRFFHQRNKDPPLSVARWNQRNDPERTLIHQNS